MTALLLEHTASAVSQVRALAGVEQVRSLSDDELLALSAISGDLRSAAAAHAAAVAGEIARRSDPALGHSGLARRSGHRTPIELIRATASTTVRDAANAVRVGLLMHDAAPPVDLATGGIPEPERPWLAPVARAIDDGILSPAHAESIATGLGEPSLTMSVRTLTDAAISLLRTRLDPDRLLRRARELRDELDAAGVAERERLRHEKRSFTMRDLADGSALVSWRVEGEDKAIVRQLYDRATSPRRGGPRFVDKSAQSHADSIAADERTTEQLASDVFAELLRQGADADSTHLLSTGAPIVRVLVTEADLRARDGIGWFEGESDAMSASTARRLACAGRLQLATLDSFGRPLNLGHTRRTFSSKQRDALATMFGGCAFPGCDRPPSWTESHHVDWVDRDDGPTDLANGLPLCRYHHLLIHDSDWIIVRDDGEFWFVAPALVDPEQRRMPAQKRAAALARLLGAVR